MSTPSFIDRLRSRSRRPEQVSLLDATIPPVLETSPGPLPDLVVRTDLPDDHWHSGDPRLAPGATALHTGDLPSPRRPVDRRPARPDVEHPERRGLHLVPEVDLRGEVLDLRASRHGSEPPAPQRAPEREAPCTEPSTWLG